MSNQSISKWAGLRDLATAIRELLIIIAIGIFFLMPETFKSFLYNSDIRSVAGIEFDWTKYNQAKQDIQFAQMTLEEIQTQLDVAHFALTNSTESQNQSQLRQAPATSPMQTSQFSLPPAKQTDMTVDVSKLVRTIDSARGKSRDITNRLKRAETNLTPPDELFERSSASDF